MIQANQPASLDKLRVRVGKTTRELRQARHWTQAELARELGVSQGRLSELEAGKGSFTAEQLLVLLGLFNVSASHFAPAPADPEVELQNALARLGATHLQESTALVPSRDLDGVEDAIRGALTSTSPRLIAALAPVIVNHVDRINFRKLRGDLSATGYENRLEWLLENTRAALEEEIHDAPPPPLSKRYRRALLVLDTALDFVPPHLRVAATSSDPEIHPPDVLDGTIRTKQSRNEAHASSSSISRRFGIISKLQPAHFAEALKAARESG
jgi:transcriptional regulator with XRE-family HTH domain